jgi:hypothetical protein
LADAEWRTGESTKTAINALAEAHDFENAAVLFDQLRQLEAARLPRYERLLRELVRSGHGEEV